MNPQQPTLTWENGTAYDLFISLLVLYDPGRYGLRPAWAAGVRSRLPLAERAFLGQAVDNFMPFSWLHALPAPKDGRTVLEALATIPVEERLATINFHAQSFPRAPKELLQEMAGRGAWDEGDQRRLKELLGREQYFKKTKKELAHILDLWVEPAQSGRMYLQALRAYYENFFAEEEARIAPYLGRAVARGRELAESLTLVPMLEELSQGLHFTALPALEEIVLVPSFWSTPLVVEHRLAKRQMLFIFGARPSTVSLVPGELVPDDLTRALKAVADPTRLRILHYLAQEPLTPTRLAERLRLRPPTVVHHLHILRLARLVRLTMKESGAIRCGQVPFPRLVLSCGHLSLLARPAMSLHHRKRLPLGLIDSGPQAR